MRKTQAQLGLLLAAFGFLPVCSQGADPGPALVTPQAQAIQDFIDHKVALWRTRLKLEDWQVTATLVARGQLPPRTLGGIHWDKPKKSAVIWIIKPAEYGLPYYEMLQDMELTIVHELIHLDLTALPRGQASRGSEERAVDGIARALLGLDRNPAADKSVND